MTDEEKKLLQETAVLADENRTRLEKIEKKFKRARVWSVVKLFLILLALIVGYFFYFSQLSSYSNIENAQQGILQKIGGSQLQDLLKGL